MRKPRVPSGLRPYSKRDRRRIARANARSDRPSIPLQRMEATIQRLEARLAAREGVRLVEQLAPSVGVSQ